MPPTKPRPEGRKWRSRIACKRCRQSKVKCGMASPPCQRCTDLKLDCSWDPDYKRRPAYDQASTSTSALLPPRAAQFGTQVGDQFQQSIRNIDPERHGRSSAGNEAARYQDHIRLSDSNNIDESEDHQQAIFRSEENATPQSASCPSRQQSYRVADIEISHELARESFETYFNKFHPHLSFMDSSRTPQDCYTLCKLLFWVIVAIAARDLQPQEDMLSRLSPYLNDAIGSLVNDAGYKLLGLGHVQALLLMACWPPLKVPYCGDRCMMLASLAMTTAVNYGYHNPGFEQEYDRCNLSSMGNVFRAERIRTWAACLAVVQHMSSDFGHPSTAILNNWKVRELCDSVVIPAFEENHSVDKDLLHYLHLQWLSNKFTARMPERASKRYTDMLLFDELCSPETSDIENFCPQDLSLLNRMRRLGLLLHVYCMYFVLQPAFTQRKAGCVRAYQIATELLTLLITEDVARDIILHGPRMTLRMIFHAACVILVVCNSSYHTDIDGVMGKVLARATETYFQLQRQGNRDQKSLSPGYAAVLLELWRHHEGNPHFKAQPPEITVRTRFSSGIVHHCFSLYYQIQAEKKRIRVDTMTTQGESAVPTTIAVDSSIRSAPQASGSDLTGDLLFTDWSDIAWLD